MKNNYLLNFFMLNNKLIVDKQFVLKQGNSYVTSIKKFNIELGKKKDAIKFYITTNRELCTNSYDDVYILDSNMIYKLILQDNIKAELVKKDSMFCLKKGSKFGNINEFKTMPKKYDITYYSEFTPDCIISFNEIENNIELRKTILNELYSNNTYISAVY